MGTLVAKGLTSFEFWTCGNYLNLVTEKLAQVFEAVTVNNNVYVLN